MQLSVGDEFLITREKRAKAIRVGRYSGTARNQRVDNPINCTVSIEERIWDVASRVKESK